MCTYVARAFLPALVLLGGCTVIRDASSHPYFKSYVGKTVALREEQKICREPDDLNYRVVRTLKMSSPMQGCIGELVTVVPAGTPVQIQSVIRQYMPISGNAWVALGRLELNDTVYEFEYYLGYLSIHRAPWEDQSVPASREPPR